MQKVIDYYNADAVFQKFSEFITTTDYAEKYGISRERAWQLISKHHVFLKAFQHERTGIWFLPWDAPNIRRPPGRPKSKKRVFKEKMEAMERAKDNLNKLVHKRYVGKMNAPDKKEPKWKENLPFY